MEFRKYQMLAKRTINGDLTDGQAELHALHGMSAEVGEIHALYQKMYQGHKIEGEHLKKEIGDLLWFIAELCTVCGFDMGKIAEMNIDKLLARYPDGFEAERSINRAEGDV